MARSDIWMKAFYAALTGSATRSTGSPESVVEQAVKIATAAEKFVREDAGTSPVPKEPHDFEQGV